MIIVTWPMHLVAGVYIGKEESPIVISLIKLFTALGIQGLGLILVSSTGVQPSLFCGSASDHC